MTDFIVTFLLIHFVVFSFKVFTNKPPFAGLRDGAVIMAIMIEDRRPQRPSEPATSRGLNDNIWDLMQACWKKERALRPNMTEVVKQIRANLAVYQELVDDERSEEKYPDHQNSDSSSDGELD